MSKYERTWEYMIVLGVCILCVMMTYAVVDATSGYVKPPPNACKCSKPDIPQCNKELWLRIKDGCD